MDDQFELSVNYGGKELLLPARFLRTGYSYKIEVDLQGQLLQFEPDEERAWRALIDPEQTTSANIKKDLLEAIAQSLDQTFR